MSEEIKKSGDRKDPHRYDDIIKMPRPVSRKHRPMSIEARAAQFAPFAALTGYDEAVEETAREYHFDDGVSFDPEIE